MKVYGGHKGFAFVEYVTKQEAQNALQALSSTHLYGRRLVCSLNLHKLLRKKKNSFCPLIQQWSQFAFNIQVLERAKEGETLEELRARTAKQFVVEENGSLNPTKLTKKRKNNDVLDERSMKFEKVAH